MPPLTRRVEAMRPAIGVFVAILATSLGTHGLPGQNASCSATSSSMTPAGWKGGPIPAATGPRGSLQVVADIPLPGPSNRFDYQSVDAAGRRLYISHMNAGRLIVVDLDSSRVVKEVPGLDRATGVWAVPAHHAVYVSAAGRHEVAVIDDRTFQLSAKIGDIRFPDGIAYAPAEHKVFVSDEAGAADVVIDARTNTKRSTIALGGEAGNTFLSRYRRETSSWQSTRHPSASWRATICRVRTTRTVFRSTSLDVSPS